MLEREWRVMSAEFLNVEVSKPNDVYNLLKPRSSCPNCKKPIRVIDNIPIISYLWLKGRCNYCSNKISIRYPFVELLTAILTTLLYFKYGMSAQLLAGALFTWLLIALTFIDLDTQLLPDNLTIPLIWLGLLTNTNNIFISINNSVLSAAGAYLFLWGFVWIFKFITGKDGMGYGDLKLFAAFGAWFGWTALPFILIFSSLFGAIVGVMILKFTNQSKDTPLPFGPYLCLAAYLYIIFGDWFINWYLGFLL